MAKVISQETFDDIVKENVIDFDMTPFEAKQETIKQFEAQGINLANIIQDLSINSETGIPVLNETVERIKTHIGEKTTETDDLLKNIDVLNNECAKSLPHRVLAAKNGAHDALVTLIESALSAETIDDDQVQVIIKCLQALNSLTNKQPDIFDAEALAAVLKLMVLDVKSKKDIIYLTLQWLQKACIMHETNRQHIVGAGIVKLLKPLTASKQPDAQLVCELTALLRFLVLDDDIRVEFGNAHEHARQIANELLLDLVHFLPQYDDDTVLADLLLTIATLAVRHEFCLAMDEAGLLQLVFNIMKSNLEAVRLNREILKLLRALAGHDTVKAHIVQQGGAPIIKQVLETHASNENIVSAAFACISTLTLREKEHSTAFFETGIAEVVVESMRTHAKNKIVQRNAAWAIRNMVSRSRNQCETWLSFGVEDLLNTAMTAHPSVAQDIKAALRDLDCKVHLREEFTSTAEKKIAA